MESQCQGVSPVSSIADIRNHGKRLCFI